MPKNVIIGSIAATLLLSTGSLAQAGQSGSARYRFTTVLDSLRDGLEATRCAAINSFGTVAVQVHDVALDINKVVTKRGARDAPVVVVDTRTVADFPTLCDNGFTSITSDPSINEKGEVAIQGNLRRVTAAERLDCQTPEQRDTPRQAVLLGKGGPLTTIAHTNNPPGGNFISEFIVADTSVNTAGDVALAIELDNSGFDQGLFVGSRDGAFDERFRSSTSNFDSPSQRMSLNEVGQIAFEDSGIVLSNPDGTFRTIVGSNGGQFASFDPSLNIFGRVAFMGFTNVDPQVRGVFTSRGGPITTVADSSGPYSTFSEPSLNDLGQVVFTADLDEFGPNGLPIQGVFTGPNPVADKVLRAGDRYAGVPVTSVFTCSEALNNFGQIVMTVQSENAATFEVRTFIVKATPRR